MNTIEKLSKELAECRTTINNLRDPGSRVEQFVLKYVAWWGKYTFDANDWATRGAIGDILTDAEKEGLTTHELFKLVRTLNVKKPRLAQFDEVLAGLGRVRAKKEKHRSEVEKQEAERAKREAWARELKEAQKHYPGDCEKCGDKRIYLPDGKGGRTWQCPKCRFNETKTPGNEEGAGTHE